MTIIVCLDIAHARLRRYGEVLTVDKDTGKAKRTGVQLTHELELRPEFLDPEHPDLRVAIEGFRYNPPRDMEVGSLADAPVKALPAPDPALMKNTPFEPEAS